MEYLGFEQTWFFLGVYRSIELFKIFSFLIHLASQEFIHVLKILKWFISALSCLISFVFFKKHDIKKLKYTMSWENSQCKNQKIYEATQNLNMLIISLGN